MLTHLYKKDISLDKKAFQIFNTSRIILVLKKEKKKWKVAGDQYKLQFYSYFAKHIKALKNT